MTSLKQIEANRRNALKSTGPISENGKQVSRRNALRHGFTAETVIEPIEDVEQYREFEAAILGEYVPETPVEEELVRRLASLFWRLRRATSIETGLLRMQGKILLDFRSSRQKQPAAQSDGSDSGEHSSAGQNGFAAADQPAFADERHQPMHASRDIALAFLRLANLDRELIERLTRYEGGLWRQTVQTLFALQPLKRR